MKNQRKKITAYFSHAIAGSKGKAAWYNWEYKWKNCKKAIKVAAWIQKNIPELILYTPGEHEELCHAAFINKYLTHPQILLIDKKIIETKDMLIILYNKEGRESKGVQEEIDKAIQMCKPIFFIKKVDEDTLTRLRNFIHFLFSDGVRG